jgi:predicted HAD superfamily Cof-like phosphohydrolase
MLLIVDLEEDGPVTAEVVRANVAQAIDMFKRGNGLSSDNDEGMINLVEVNLFSGDTLQRTVDWFTVAFPNLTDKSRSTQLGVHFEEVAEMVAELEGADQNAILMLARLHTALQDVSNYAKTNPGSMYVPEDRRLAFVDSLADQIVTAAGCAFQEGMDIVGALDEVNRSNYSKFDENEQPIKDSNGKVIKGPNYSPADLRSFI